MKFIFIIHEPCNSLLFKASMEVFHVKTAREIRDSFATMPCGFCNTKIEDGEVSLYVGERDKGVPDEE